MNDGCLVSRRLAWSARILASHDMGTNDAPVRLRRTYPYRTLIDELQRHARHDGLFLSRRECDSLTNRLKVLMAWLPAAWTLRGVVSVHSEALYHLL